MTDLTFSGPFIGAFILTVLTFIGPFTLIVLAFIGAFTLTPLTFKRLFIRTFKLTVWIFR